MPSCSNNAIVNLHVHMYILRLPFIPALPLIVQCVIHLLNNKTAKVSSWKSSVDVLLVECSTQGSTPPASQVVCIELFTITIQTSLPLEEQPTPCFPPLNILSHSRSIPLSLLFFYIDNHRPVVIAFMSYNWLLPQSHWSIGDGEVARWYGQKYCVDNWQTLRLKPLGLSTHLFSANWSKKVIRCLVR